jgi:hypothetical protein
VRIVRDLCDAPNMKAVIIRVIYLLLLVLLFQHSCPLVRSFLLQSSCQVLSTLFRSAPGISTYALKNYSHSAWPALFIRLMLARAHISVGN